MKEEDFKRALYMVDIGQNDLALAFGNSSYAQVVERIPTFIAEIEYAIVVSPPFFFSWIYTYAFCF